MNPNDLKFTIDTMTHKKWYLVYDGSSTYCISSMEGDNGDSSRIATIYCSPENSLVARYFEVCSPENIASIIKRYEDQIFELENIIHAVDDWVSDRDVVENIMELIADYKKTYGVQDESEGTSLY